MLPQQTAHGLQRISTPGKAQSALRCCPPVASHNPPIPITIDFLVQEQAVIALFHLGRMLRKTKPQYRDRKVIGRTPEGTTATILFVFVETSNSVPSPNGATRRMCGLLFTSIPMHYISSSLPRLPELNVHRPALTDPAPQRLTNEDQYFPRSD